MTTGTKIFLAVFALIIGVLVVYYGVMAPGARSPGDGKVANNDKPREPAADHRDAVGPGAGGSAERDRAAPPPREPAPLAPQPAAPAPTAASTAGGLLSEGVREAEHNNGLPNQAQAQVQPTDASHSGAPPATPFLPLVGLNGGNLKSSTEDSPKGDIEPHSAPVANPSSPASVSPAAGASSAQPSRVPPQPPQPPQRTAYTIKSGDTFVSIAEQWLGDKNKWSLIARENPTVDPQRLRIGQKIYLPSKDAARAAPKPEPVVANGEHLYIVQSGDTLSSIAREVFGDAKMWEEIYKQNQDAIGKDAGTLKVGMKLKLPKKTT